MRKGAEVNMRAIPKLLVGLIVSVALAVPAFGLETFQDEAKAQQHCPKDIVVWLNLPTMIWHYKGQRWYANTKHGAYACEKGERRDSRALTQCQNAGANGRPRMA
jgi:hypothetical protein